MSSIHRRGGKYRAMYRDGGGKTRSRTFDRKADAQRWLHEVEADLARGAWIDPNAGRMTVAAYVEGWVAAQEWRTSTRELALSHLRVHILPAFGHRPLESITRTDVQGFVAHLSRTGLAPSTVDTIYRRLVSILESAVYDRLLVRSPAVKIRLPKRGRRHSDSVVVLALDDVGRIADDMPEWIRAIVWTMAMSGLRAGEAAGLTLERVDFLRKEIIVDRQLTTVAGEGPRLAPPKTDSSVRTVPIGDSLIAELNRHLRVREPVEFEPGAHLLFTSRDRRPLWRSVLSGYWRRSAVRLDLPPEARGWHTLRHTYASMLIEGGLSVRAVQARLGHASATETLDTYAHLWPDTDDDTRTVVETAFSNIGRAHAVASAEQPVAARRRS